MPTKTKATHTPLPWVANGLQVSWHKPDTNFSYRIADADFGGDEFDKPTVNANARFIVRACNSHEALLDALGIAALTLEAAYLNYGSNIAAKVAAKTARAAIALATE